jgi:putative mRNA 3-end processing factor
MPLCFVSHAHTDHIARHAHSLATPETLAFMAHRLGPLPTVTALSFRKPHSLQGLVVELFPAGHVLGAAQVRVTRNDGRRLVYTGDVCLSPSRTTALAELLQCDVLVIEATFGHPRYVFPPREAVYDEVAHWSRQQLERGVRPVLLAYGFGKSQETIAQLNARGIAVCADERVWEMAQLYRQFGVPIEARRYDGTLQPGEVCVFPPRGVRDRLAGHGPLVLAALTGWALEPWGARRSGADIAFPISDHSDYQQLLQYAQDSGAREVVTVHGFAEELAVSLRREGLFSRALTERLQMALPLG